MVAAVTAVRFGPASVRAAIPPHAPSFKPGLISRYSSSFSTISPPATAASSSTDPRFKADPSYRVSSLQPGPRSRLTRTLFLLGWIPVAAFITSHLYSIGNVTGGSMSPTFNGPHHIASAANARSDVVLLNRTVKYKHNELRTGDIVTLISPLDPRLLLTKRIIALPGDTVRVWVSGAGRTALAGRWTRIKVPPGHVWVEGDAAVDIIPGSLERVANSSSAASSVAGLRTKSRDSREFGPVPMGLITSRIEMILWPPARFGAPAPRPSLSSLRPSPTQYPPSTTAQDTSTQVNPSLARILDEMTQVAPNARAKAHPQDSIVSPYVDWNSPPAHDEGKARISAQGEETRTRKVAWNNLSRGGRLGDDAA